MLRWLRVDEMSMAGYSSDTNDDVSDLSNEEYHQRCQSFDASLHFPSDFTATATAAAAVLDVSTVIHVI